MLLRRMVAVASVLAAVTPLGPAAFAGPPAGDRLDVRSLPRPQRSPGDLGPDFDPHAVLVQFKPDASATAVDRAVKGRNAQMAGNVAGTRFVKVTTAGPAADLAREIAKDPAVSGVSLNYRRKANSTPNDPGYTFNDQDYLNTVRLPQAWDRSMGSSDQVIAVVDGGVDGTHPDLVGRVLAGYDAIANTAIAAGANSDGNGHGTMVAGIAGANTNNGAGITSVAWNARIMPVKVLDAAGSGYDSDIAEGVAWAADHGARIINMSLGGPGDSQVLHDAVTYATNKGALIVASAGNDFDDTVQYPAAYPEVLAVAGTDASGKVTDFSSRGDWVDVAAPAFGIVSTGADHGYFKGNGTSYSAPIVAGVAALMRANNAALTPAQLIATIKATARDAGPRGLDPYYGAGLLDAFAAVGGAWAPELPLPALGANEPNDVPARATVFTGSATGTIGVEGDVDWYRFDSTAAQSVSVRVTPAGNDVNFAQNLDALVEVYDHDLRVVGTANAATSGGVENVYVTLGVGTYYVAVRNSNGAADTRSYTLAVVAVPSTVLADFYALPVPAGLKTVAAGDVTGDGRTDVVAVTGTTAQSADARKLLVFAQGRYGALARPAMYPTQLQSTDVGNGLALLDTNGDGRRDVALATAAGVQLFQQAADGRLTDNGLLAGTAGAWHLAAADMDGDGDTDLVVIGSAGILLLSQDPAGTFTASTVATGTAQDEEVEVGDVDGDGRPDIVRPRSGVVNVFHNSTSGWSRTDHSPATTGPAIAGVEVADVTGDGRADIVATMNVNGAGAKVDVFAQDGAGGLAAAVEYATAASPMAVEAADLTGDGRSDVIAVHGSGSGKVSLLSQKADGTLDAAAAFTTPAVGAYDPQGLVLADVNGDNRPDVVTADVGRGLRVLYDTAGFAQGGETEWVKSLGIADFATGVALDAVPTITFARAVDPAKVKLVSGATGQVVPAAVTYDAGTFTATVTPSAALLDNTGYRLVVEGVFTSTFRTVDTVPAAVTNLQANGGTAVVSWTAPAVTDLDQVVIRAAAGATAPSSVTAGIGLYAGAGTSFTAANLTPGTAYTVRAFTRDRSGKITAGPSASLTVSAYRQRVDFNGDSFTDIAGIDANNDIKLYTGDGTGKLTNGGAMWATGGLWAGFKHIVAGDFNNDGKVDIAGIDANSDIRLYTGNGTGQLVGAGAAMWPTGGLWAGFKKIVAGDFNGDGKVDIAGIDANNDLKLYPGNGAGSLVGPGSAMWPTGGLWAGFKHIEAGDFNGDGKVDVAGIDANNDIKLYTGNGAGLLVGTGSAMWPTGGLWAGFKYIVAGDFTNDGKADIAGIDANNDLKYYTGNGTGQLVGSGNAMWPPGGMWVGFKQLT
ncbi:FG-GAP-like repeat-containing protein [Dactylosporangium matsuzakiense]|uniref:Fibronectin type-III domain-containing protein n=1 Tax=Dactylosporangium matsuzakiense TaxID=53360 RepID=A0A9W6NPQ0_9ACTN|nr:FG-GAP-like repeat-containing protein [Dactylosporangium matsuzakiense]UWZ44574.1 VCBS repeat-containing protein [Dactylosporangium matsuzakiense]GLL05335.1 hypothetical protein GCM10017581_070820 [Dactylosporangium matsuzakiense]